MSWRRANDKLPQPFQTLRLTWLLIFSPHQYLMKLSMCNSYSWLRVKPKCYLSVHTKLVWQDVHTPKCGLFPISTHPHMKPHDFGISATDEVLHGNPDLRHHHSLHLLAHLGFGPQGRGFLVLNRQSDRFTRIKQDDVDLLDWFPTKQLACLHQ